MSSCVCVWQCLYLFLAVDREWMLKTLPVHSLLYGDENKCGHCLSADKTQHRFETFVAGADKYNAITVTYAPSNIKCGMWHANHWR